jgi:hypothetical protein
MESISARTPSPVQKAHIVKLERSQPPELHIDSNSFIPYYQQIVD